MQKDTAIFALQAEAKVESTVAHLVHEASAFSASIYLMKDERQANAKSLLGVISLGIMPGDKISLLAEGADEVEAILALKSFLEGKGKQ